MSPDGLDSPHVMASQGTRTTSRGDWTPLELFMARVRSWNGTEVSVLQSLACLNH